MILTADDDYIYPAHMATDMLTTHARTFYSPVAGNGVWRYGYKCHCGGCSLVQPIMFRGWDKYLQYWEQLPSDDMFYTLMAAKNGFRYYASAYNWEKLCGGQYHAVNPYSTHGMVAKTYKKTIQLFEWV